MLLQNFTWPMATLILTLAKLIHVVPHFQHSDTYHSSVPSFIQPSFLTVFLATYSSSTNLYSLNMCILT